MTRAEKMEGGEREEKGESHTPPDKSTTLSPSATLRDYVKVVDV